jgi:hypothetical protein
MTASAISNKRYTSGIPPDQPPFSGSAVVAKPVLFQWDFAVRTYQSRLFVYDFVWRFGVS